MALVRKYFFIGLILSLILGAVFAFLGVYDTNNKPLFYRYVFWTSTMIVGTLGTAFALPVVTQSWMPKQHRFLQLFVVALLISLPVTLVLAGFDHRFGADWTIKIWLLQYRYVVVISLILIFGGYFVLKAQGIVDAVTSINGEKQQEINIPSHENTVDVAVSRFLKRLPEHYKSAEIYAVSSADHYLRVYTDLGEELILMRLMDALKELEQVPGMQTHRSWWVAFDGVAERQRNQGKQSLRLKSGVIVPVSRSFDKAVKEAHFG
jgi:hypothetical protein